MTDKPDKKVRVRFAPSPTGPLHMGGVRTALYNYLFAKQNNGTLILRIEDTDQTRKVEGAEEYILEALEWSGIKFDEGIHVGGEYGPYRQSERKDTYKQYAEQLVQSENAYYAFDTPEELDEMRKQLKDSGVASPQYNAASRSYMKNSLNLPADKVQQMIDEGVPYVIRIKVPRNEEIKFQDMVRNWVSFQSKQVDDKVILKADGMPTYHLANVVDDKSMKITHVIRGEEWLPSTPIHVLLYRYLGWEQDMPQFAHLPLILRPDGKGKLSKRDGDKLGFPVYPTAWQDPETMETSGGFRETGFFPDAFLNMLAFLGWNPGTEQEVFPIEEMIKAFSIDRIGKTGAKFDFDKAKWFNQEYMKRLSDQTLADSFKIKLQEENIQVEDDVLLQIAGLLKERLVFLSDFWEHGSFFFQTPDSVDKGIIQKKWNDELASFFEASIAVIESISDFSSENIEEIFKGAVDEHKLSLGQVMPVFRQFLTGTKFGPPLFDVAAVLGKEEVIKRIKNAQSMVVNTA